MALQVKEDELCVDLSGSSPQVMGAINCTLLFAKSAVYFAVRAIMDSDAPNNSGFMRPIRCLRRQAACSIRTRPAAVAARGVSGFRLVDAMFGALAQAVPETRAAGEGGTTSYSIGGRDDAGRFVLFREALMGAWGAGFRREGIDGTANPAANIGNAPVEMVEHQAPILIEKYGLVADSGGPGKWRGGVGGAAVRYLGKRATFQLRSDRRTHPPYRGLAWRRARIALG